MQVQWVADSPMRGDSRSLGSIDSTSGIDQLDANIRRVVDITGGKRNIAADGYAGDLHIGCLKRSADTARVCLQAAAIAAGASLQTFFDSPVELRDD